MAFSDKGPSIKDVGNLLYREEGSKIANKLEEKTTDMGEGGVKNPEKLPTSFMDGPLCIGQAVIA